MSKKDQDNIEEYLRYAKSRSVPEDYEDWVLDNGIKLPPKKRKNGKDDYDDTE